METHMPGRKQTPASPLDAHLGFWLRFVSNQVSARFSARLATRDITVTEWVALRTLYDRPQTSHADLIAALGMTKGAASKVVSRLENKGLASRQPSEDSAREQLLSLTRAGLALVPVLAALADDNEQEFFSHLGVRERRQMKKLLQGLVAHHRITQVPTE